MEFPRDENALGVVAWVVVGLVSLVGVLGAAAGILYASDYGIEATVVDKACGGGVFTSGANSVVTVKTRMFGIEHTVKGMDDALCSGLRAGQDGNFVIYHVQSERTILYEREGGACLYDSRTGLC